MVKVSVVMPLYNSEKYLEECIQSIQRQTFTDFEVICINDASEDATLEILKKFQNEDSRIRVYSNEKRQGAAFSRNRGMKFACGKYLAFLDGDDIFDESMLDIAYRTIEERKTDIVLYNYTHVPSNLIHNKLEVQHSKKYIERYCREPFTIWDCEPCEFSRWCLGPWNKLYRKEFIENNQIVFQDLPSSNDVYFVYMALMLSSSLIVVNDMRVMVYIRDHSESTRISNNRDPMCAYYAFIQLGMELIKRNKFDDLLQYYYVRVFWGLLSALRATKEEREKKKFYVFLKDEGIGQLRMLGESRYFQVYSYIRYNLEAFQKKEYESKWFLEKDIMLEMYMYHHEKDIIGLFRKCAKKGISVGIWGAGGNGRTFLRFCIKHHFRIAAVIDRSKKKHGSILYGHEIISPKEAWNKIQLIIVSAYGISDEVIREVGERKIKVIELKDFLGIV